MAKTSAEKHFVLAHILAMLSLITSTVLIPCFGSFKYAYDALSELSSTTNCSSQRLRTSCAHLQYSDKDVIASQATFTTESSAPDRYDSPLDTCVPPERPSLRSEA
jgi:hypothetical protein